MTDWLGLIDWLIMFSWTFSLHFVCVLVDSLHDFWSLICFLLYIYHFILLWSSVSVLCVKFSHWVFLYPFVAVKSACGSEYFECRVIFQCIPKLSYLDGIFDCIDRTDEPNVGKTVFNVLIAAVFHLLKALLFELYWLITVYAVGA